jgi:hypothetical protein
MPRTGACIWSDRMGLGRTNESLRTALWSDKGFISPTKYMNWSIGDGLDGSRWLLSLIATTASLPFFLFTLPADLSNRWSLLIAVSRQTSDLVIGHKK